MNRNIAVLSLVGFAAVAAPGWAQTKAAAVSVPPAPVVPKYLRFDDEAAGRRLLFAAQDALQKPYAVGFTVRFTVHGVTGTGSPAAPLYAGTETVKAEAGARRLSLSTETTRGTAKAVRHVIADGQSLVATRYEDRGIATPPTREYVRLPLDETSTLSRALRAVDVSPVSLGAGLIFRPLDLHERAATVWRGTPVTQSGARREVVLEVEPLDRGRTVTRARRYTLDPATRRLVHAEEWTTRQERARPARRGAPADDGVRVTYRREDYSGYPSASVRAFPVTAYAQSLPASYVEKPLPTVRLPGLDLPPTEADPRALALLEKWRTAQERYLSLNLGIEQSVRMTPRTPESPAIPPEMQNVAFRYTAQVRRLGRTRVTQERVRGGDDDRDFHSLLLVSDGKQVRALDRTANRSRTRDLRDPNDLWDRLEDSGINDWGDAALQWVYDGVPDAEDFTRIAYGGRTTLDTGEAVEIIVLEEVDSEAQRRRRGGAAQVRERTERLRVALGADGLPRQIDAVFASNVSGLFERDQRPVLTVVTRYRTVSVDREPASSAFVLPAEVKTAGRQ